MKQRFRIPEVLEFYGSTEGNVSMFNFDGHEGAIGRVPKWLRNRFNIRLVQFDVETEEPIRGLNGLCIEAGPGQVGECLGEIGGDARAEYAGYADKGESEKKILRDVFEKGDAWFATGDLMKTDADGYFYFVDRVGDTFRWKGENVSTNEVAERLLAAPGVEEANVYGVEVTGAEGARPVMAEPGHRPRHSSSPATRWPASLPSYAQPLVRLGHPAGARHHRHLQDPQDGPHRRRLRSRKIIKGPLYFHDPKKGYVKVTKRVFEKIAAGAVKL